MLVDIAVAIVIKASEIFRQLDAVQCGTAQIRQLQKVG